ncbi:MAG: cadherin-like beta sandwich domain-containing protein [Candidatus Latescibacteria bacterium]|nr:cadherin-like beta sandwich domain-containing protein [Candidatus Latescibacterota bacterium]
MEQPSLKALAISPGKLSPGFSPGRRQYTVYVPHHTAAVSLIAEVDEPGTALRVNGLPAINGQPSSPVPLQVGRNVLWVEPGGYEVKVVRAHVTPTWVRVQEHCSWSPRDSAGEVVFKGRMWLFGGYTPGLVADVWSSADGADWRQEGEIPSKSGINIPVNWVHGGRMWVADNEGSLFASADGAHWERVNDQTPWKGRYATGGAVFAGRMWVLGGKSAGTLHHDVWSSADGVQWTLETAKAPWSPRQVFSMLAVHRDQLWLVGGGITSYHPFKAYREVWSSPDGRNWAKMLDEAPWPGRIWSTVLSYKNRLWLLGGFRAEPTWNNFADTWYSADGVQWRELVCPEGWSARHELSAYVFAGKLWVVGGNSWPLADDVWCLEIPGLCFLTSPVVEEFAGAQYRYSARADFNQSGGPLRYRLVEGPGWLSVNEGSGLVSGIPEEVGQVEVEIEAGDAEGERIRQRYTLHVLPVP